MATEYYRVMKNLPDPFQLMLDLSNRAVRISVELGIPNHDLKGWAMCLDMAWEQMRPTKFKTRQELARWCNLHMNQRGKWAKGHTKRKNGATRSKPDHVGADDAAGAG